MGVAPLLELLELIIDPRAETYCRTPKATSQVLVCMYFSRWRIKPAGNVDVEIPGVVKVRKLPGIRPADHRHVLIETVGTSDLF